MVSGRPLWAGPLNHVVGRACGYGSETPVTIQSSGDMGEFQHTDTQEVPAPLKAATPTALRAAEAARSR